MAATITLSRRTGRKRRRWRRRAGSLAAAALHRFASGLFTLVLILHTATLTLFLALAGSTPARGGLLELLWVYDRQVLGLALVATLLVSLPLTILAWSTSRRSRLGLALIWIVFATVLATHRAEAVEVVSRVVWNQRVVPRLDR